MASENQLPSRKGASGLIFVGCLMLGLAIGLLTGEVAVAIPGGLGIGFIGMAVVRYKAGEW